MNALKRHLQEKRGGLGSFLLVRSDSGRVLHRIDVTDCPWCGADDDRAICSVCADKADRARRGITRSHARLRSPPLAGPEAQEMKP